MGMLCNECVIAAAGKAELLAELTKLHAQRRDLGSSYCFDGTRIVPESRTWGGWVGADYDVPESIEQYLADWQYTCRVEDNGDIRILAYTGNESSDDFDYLQPVLAPFMTGYFIWD